jgi:hypothetical protein
MAGFSSCVPATCESNSDCTAAPKGVCGIVLAQGSQAGDFYASAVRCIYPLVDLNSMDGKAALFCSQMGGTYLWQSGVTPRVSGCAR